MRLPFQAHTACFGNLVAAAALLLALLGLTPGAAAALRHPRLVVAAGSVGLVGEQLRGSFVVRNEGGRRSGAAVARLVVRGRAGRAPAKRFALAPLAAGKARAVEVDVRAPTGLPAGAHPLAVCVARCLAVGTLQVGADSGPVPQERSGAPQPGPSGLTPGRPVDLLPPGPDPPVAEPVYSIPTDPVPFTAGTPLELSDALTDYWVDVPRTYDASHRTPTPLLVWLHGCGGTSSGDIWVVSPGGAQDWISIAVGGREGDCWNPSGDGSKVMAAIADVERHFNVDRHRVILGGYSAGGDLAYRLAFYDADAFAGVLAENTSPFRDTGSTQAASLAAASWKFPVVHLAHLQDTTYPIAEVRAETDAMAAAGFPVTRIEVPGHHWDDPGDEVSGQPQPGTDADLRTLLLPHIDDGWRSP